MKLVYFLFVLVFVSSQQLQAQIQKDSVIYWRANYSLKWNDFLAKPTKVNLVIKVFENDEPLAATVTNIACKGYYLNDNILSFIVISEFLKYESWTKDTSLIGLEHEQIHFDIAEIYARKMRKDIAVLTREKVKNQYLFQNLIDSLLQEREHVEDKFDRETLHGRVLNAQSEWREKISKELEKLKDYEIVDYKKYLEGACNFCR